jgi:hypothetical protein
MRRRTESYLLLRGTGNEVREKVEDTTPLGSGERHVESGKEAVNKLRSDQRRRLVYAR